MCNTGSCEDVSYRSEREKRKVDATESHRADSEKRRQTSPCLSTQSLKQAACQGGSYHLSDPYRRIIMVLLGPENSTVHCKSPSPRTQALRLVPRRHHTSFALGALKVNLLQQATTASPADHFWRKLGKGSDEQDHRGYTTGRLARISRDRDWLRCMLGTM